MLQPQLPRSGPDEQPIERSQLEAEHRKNDALYRDRIARAISAYAHARGMTADSYDAATILISLVDGLWPEQCIDQSALSLARAKDLCRRTLGAVLVPAGR